MNNNYKNEYNRFDVNKTNIVLVHDGRFHADDIMFVAMAAVMIEKTGRTLFVKRVNKVPIDYSENIIVGDIGYGVYDHHTSNDGSPAIGCNKNTKNRTVAACGLLYDDIKDILFPEESETKKVFGALIDIIEHCDNSADSNTFSDAINYLTPVSEKDFDEGAMNAIHFCKDVVKGFVAAHEKEMSGKLWAIPKVVRGVVPGVDDKKDERYWKPSAQVKNRYKYISFNDESDVKVSSFNTYSIACSVLTQQKRLFWKAEIEKIDSQQIEEMAKRESEFWPQALASMKDKTIYLDKYFPYGQHVKDMNALFVVIPSQRGGYNVHFLKTSNGKYRFNPDLMMNFEGRIFVANDKRFISFDTLEHALNAAHTSGRMTDTYLKEGGLNAYRNVYGGILKEEYTGDFFKDLISESVALNMYIKDTVKDLNNLSSEDYRRLQICVADNPYLIHTFCIRFDSSDENMKWLADKSVTDIENLSKDTLLTKTITGKNWDFGILDYLQTEAGINLWNKVFPHI